MRVIVLVTAVAALAAALAAQNIKSDYYLDIPGHTQTGTSGAGAFFPRQDFVSSTSHPPPNPLKLTLLSIDRIDFIYGERFTYDILIENTGKEPVTLPWSPDRGAFVQPAPRTPDGFRRGMVYLVAESAAGVQLGLLDGQSLYGSNEVPRSLLSLASGKTARIRVAGWWSAGTDEARAAILRQPDGVVQLRAVFSTQIDDFPSKQSINTVAVRVGAGRVE